MTIFVHNKPYSISYLTKEKSTQAISEWQRKIQIQVIPMLQDQKVNVPWFYTDMPESSTLKISAEGPNSLSVRIIKSIDG